VSKPHLSSINSGPCAASMLPEKCQLELTCDQPQLSSADLVFHDLIEPINYGLQRPPLQLDTCSPLDRTPVSSLECEDSWKRAKEDWFTTRSSYGLPNPFAGPSCPPSSPEPTWNPPGRQQPESTSGKTRPGSANRLNGDVPYPPDVTRAPTGTRYARLPKEELSNLFLQTYTFDIICHSVELGQILYNHLSEMFESRYFILI
jgi:hypothetical protein